MTGPVATMMRRLIKCGVTLSSVVYATFANCEEPFELRLPLNCEIGRNCFVQNYVDHDPSGNIRDFSCGRRTYDGHDGTDFRIPDMTIQRKGVEVLAGAPGRILRMRDGVDDVLGKVVDGVVTAGRECGNGVVIEHQGGWTTQYCHMAKHSVRGKPGDQVEAGHPIGLVGLSGHTEFPHLHLTVRHNGKVVDPFSYGTTAGTCGSGSSIWASSTTSPIVYRTRQVLNSGLVDRPATMDLVESGETEIHSAKTNSEMLVGYVRSIGLEAGDRQTITIKDPAEVTIAEHDVPALETDKAQYLISAGRRRRDTNWPAGVYKIVYRVWRDGIEVLNRAYPVTLN